MSPRHSYRTFTQKDQLDFALLSGDHNPLHVDPVESRRLLFGSPVVHGIHQVLWALNIRLSGRSASRSIGSIDVEFHKPVRVGERAELTWTITDTGDTCGIRTPEHEATTLRITWLEQGGLFPDIPSTAPSASAPDAHDRETLPGMHGHLPLQYDPTALQSMFPSASRALPAAQIATLLASTRLVGMRCPGLDSLFKSLHLNPAVNVEHRSPMLRFSVTSFEKRFSVVRMAVDGGSMAGTISAFVRPGKQAQPRFSDLKGRVRQDAFKGWRALVVGGSRGLGELSAKLLAAGGADVVLTYRQGSADAERVVDEIRSGGGSARAIELDVTSRSDFASRLPNSGAGITHLLYFATPPIFVAERGSFRIELFEQFCSVYVDAFTRLVGTLAPLGLRSALSPSSSAIDDIPVDMGEYASAKAAAEVAARFLAKVHAGLTVHTPRLPRLPTDQTNSLLPVRAGDPVTALLEALSGL